MYTGKLHPVPLKQAWNQIGLVTAGFRPTTKSGEWVTPSDSLSARTSVSHESPVSTHLRVWVPLFLSDRWKQEKMRTVLLAGDRALFPFIAVIGILSGLTLGSSEVR